MKTNIRRIGLITLLTAALALPALVSGQQLYTKDASGDFLPVLATNSVGVPFLSGPGMDLLESIGTWTNWGVATFGIYEPASAGHKASFGAGALALYNLAGWAATGIGIDYMNNQTTEPSAQFQLQAPFFLGGTNGVQVTPFAFTGIATPIGGSGAGNASVVGLFGAGLDVKISGGFGVFYAIEQRTGQPALWNLIGLRYSKAL
jgi:hypothetical protein